ncbi:ArdC family protein [Sphingopyxis chilensis]|uniref:ArdC family protein n=1 Tax=Sphingopyxis chilensis TaxID=180400 RepID=UPI002DDCA321|nr:zincin-like metallopeptidase domain-containing protein [Sphingopyxis chilensis]
MLTSPFPSLGTAPQESARPSGRARARGGARAKAPPTDGAPRASLYDEVTGRIVQELEAGRIPWVQPWDGAAFAPGLPKNADARRAYSGINILILWAEAARRGFPAQGWLTFRQALGAGGAVRKGEKGTTIFYAARFTPKGEAGTDLRGGDHGARGPGAAHTRGGGAGAASAAAGGERAGSAGDGGAVPFLKRFTVFNVAQCEGLPDRCTRADVPLPPRETIPDAEALIAATGADIRIGGNEAYYSPAEDYVALPPQQSFRQQIDYYRTVLHELGHWTGHPSRLDRDQKGGFASAAYGREELCAELASAFLCAALGIKPTVRHADYIGAWLAIMRADTRAIFRAASHASKAADYLLGFAPAAEQGAAGASTTTTRADGAGAAGEGQ